MKACIVSVSAPRNTVMVSVYTDYFMRNHIPYDMIYRDKYHREELTGAENNYRFETNNEKPLQKLLGDTAFVRYAKRILSENRYDFVVVWGELTAALLSGYLKRHYKNRYCINIRDLLEGKRKFFNPKLNQAIRSSSFTTVSSERYLETLPKDGTHYCFFHSFNQKIMSETDAILEKRQKNTDGPINILYIGNIRFYEHAYRLLDALANDDRFVFSVVGHGSEPVKEYAALHGIHNVRVEGIFPKEKTGEYLAQADVIYNLYGTDNLNLRTALSNKLYYACCLNLPILVYRDTYMFEMADRCGIGFAVDDFTAETLADGLYTWYQHLDRKEIRDKCNALICEAKDSQKRLYQLLEESLSLN